LGGDHKAWQWGKLHHYGWTGQSAQLAAALSGSKPSLVKGPVAAGGDHTTLNASGYRWGQDFEAVQASTLRIIVDFSQIEPMMGQNGAGQSGNPASPNYADGVEPWLKGQYLSIPMQPENFERAYGKARLTLTPGK
jgi:acyl-homoserine-lactone acylase